MVLLLDGASFSLCCFSTGINRLIAPDNGMLHSAGTAGCHVLFAKDVDVLLMLRIIIRGMSQIGTGPARNTLLHELTQNL